MCDGSSKGLCAGSHPAGVIDLKMRVCGTEGVREEIGYLL